MPRPPTVVRIVFVTPDLRVDCFILLREYFVNSVNLGGMWFLVQVSAVRN